MKHWQTYLKGVLNGRIIHFLNLYFKSLGIVEPTVKDFTDITEAELFESWLSVPSMKEFQLFQQQLVQNNETV